MSDKLMSLAEIADWLGGHEGWRYDSSRWYCTTDAATKRADAIRAHLKTCGKGIDPEKVRALIQRLRMEGSTYTADQIQDNLLPAEPTALERAIEIAKSMLRDNERPVRWDMALGDMVDALEQAQKEAKL